MASHKTRSGLAVYLSSAENNTRKINLNTNSDNISIIVVEPNHLHTCRQLRKTRIFAIAYILVSTYFFSTKEPIEPLNCHGILFSNRLRQQYTKLFQIFANNHILCHYGENNVLCCREKQHTADLIYLYVAVTIKCYHLLRYCFNKSNTVRFRQGCKTRPQSEKPATTN